MKQFPFNPNKKVVWVAALGLSLASTLSLHTPEIGARDLASESTRIEKFGYDGKVHDIQIVKTMDKDRVLVIYKKETEGKACEATENGCFSSTIIKADFDNIELIKDALRKKLDESKANTVAKAKVDEEPAEPKSKEELKDERDKRAFDRVVKACSREIEEDLLKCKVSGMIEVLRKNKPARSLALEFFRSEIESDLLRALSCSIDTSAREAFARHQMYGGDFNPASIANDCGLNPARRERALIAIDQIDATVPGEYKFLRERVALLAAESVRRQAMSVKNKTLMAENFRTSNPQLSLQYQQQSLLEMQAFYDLHSRLGQVQTTALQQALGMNYITSADLDLILNKIYFQNTQPIVQGMSNPKNLTIPEMIIWNTQPAINGGLPFDRNQPNRGSISGPGVIQRSTGGNRMIRLQ
ncbi:MAG: hypothetical protein N2578_04660 [Bdellovibrionaceae bacterium]|nr:hypothetical protein [Pseudobdellovibrionaceae bacterium]